MQTNGNADYTVVKVLFPAQRRRIHHRFPYEDVSYMTILGLVFGGDDIAGENEHGRFLQA